MSQLPITFLEKKWASTSGTNSLIRAATQTTDRVQIDLQNRDSHRSLSHAGRRVLESLGRFLYWNCPPVKAAVDEQARLAVSSFIPQFYGADKAWGKQAEELLWESDKFIDVRGAPFSMKTYLANLVREVLVDGMQGTLLAEVDGEAKIQVWRSHRIGSRQSIVRGGRYDGATIIDGVVVNDWGTSIAYGLTDGQPYSDPFTFVSANDFILAFLPSFSDQFHGVSTVGSCAFEWQDVNESRQFQLMVQKINSTIAYTVQNETGTVDKAKTLLRAASTAPVGGQAQDLPTEIHSKGRVMYFKAGQGQGIEPVKDDRPSANFMAFQEEIIRSNLESMGWSFDFFNPTKAGGAQMRIVIEKIEARLGEIRSLIVEPVCSRLAGWRISKAIKKGRLKENPEWYKWTFQGPAKLTADRKYDSEIDLAETARGIMTDQKACGKRGDYYEEVYDQRTAEADMKWERAEQLAKKRGISIQMAYSSMWENNPNGIASSGASETESGPKIDSEAITNDSRD